MNRKVILLNLVLIALAGVCVWQLRLKSHDAVAHQQAVLSKAPRPQNILPPPPVPAVKTPIPAEYVDVAQRTLFAKDRNPNVIVVAPPAPPPPPPPPPMPALPTYSGQMALGEPVIFLTLAGTDQKGYHAGDDVGPFKVIAFDRQMVTFEWDGKTVERELSELKPKEAPPQAAASNPAPAPAAGAAVSSGSQITSLAAAAPAASPSANKDKGPSLGNDMGGGYRGCAVGDTSPAGTVLSGYRKVMTQTLMGSSCHWEQMK